MKKLLVLMIFLFATGGSLLASNADDRSGNENSAEAQFFRLTDQVNDNATRFCNAYGMKSLGLIALGALYLLGSHCAQLYSSPAVVHINPMPRASVVPHFIPPQSDLTQFNTTHPPLGKPQKIKFNKQKNKR